MYNVARLFRCPCCGQWCWTYTWDKRRIIYCLDCEGRNHRGGHNTCEGCVELRRDDGSNMADHWQEPRPFFCVTMDAAAMRAAQRDYERSLH